MIRFSTKLYLTQQPFYMMVYLFFAGVKNYPKWFSPRIQVRSVDRSIWCKFWSRIFFGN